MGDDAWLSTIRDCVGDDRKHGTEASDGIEEANDQEAMPAAPTCMA